MPAGESRVQTVSFVERTLATARKLESDRSFEMRKAWECLDRALGSTAPDSRGIKLAGMVQSERENFAGFERMTPAERKHYANRVRSCATELAELLKSNYLLSEFTWDRMRMAEKSRDQPVAWPGRHFGNYHLPSALMALASAVDDWFDISRPIIGRPNAINAERLFMLRTLAENFRLRFGTPLYPVCYGVICALYGAEDLTLDDAARVIRARPQGFDEELEPSAE